MYPYTHQPQNPLAGLDLYDPQIRQLVMQHYTHLAHMLPQVQQQFYQPQYQQQYAPPPPAVPDFGLTLAEQQFLYQNANLIPAFYQTADGKVLNKMLVEGLQKMLGVSSGADTTATVATQTGNATG
ncbi:TPA: hypothetical protein ACQ98W_004794 [Citrobacter braakii]|uniref:hypothetical protein n=1 Tax=Citrobacter sp. KTE151 TaxID=1169322 RepID=UPI00032FF20F|nr:hypothetical protein [Citrobacter sp. KTE151]EOQ46931.1 hypothetical protein WC7_03563 [Citrobacter sp. KTE151]NCL82530.1 hypothetical protein [Citrobacter braakii]